MKTFRTLWRKYLESLNTDDGMILPKKVKWNNVKHQDVTGIIIGQDPYAFTYKGEVLATDIPFATDLNFAPLALKTIKKAYNTCIEETRHKSELDNSLKELNERGILLLHAIPTTLLGRPLAHNIPIIDYEKLEQIHPYEVTAQYIKEVLILRKRKGLSVDIPILCLGKEAEKVAIHLDLPYTTTIHPSAIKHGMTFDEDVFRKFLMKIL